MSRSKGTPKTGGRSKGTPNKVTDELKRWIAKIISKNKGRFEADITEVSPEYRLKMLEKLMAYIVPRQTSVNVMEMMEAEYKQLEALLDNAPAEAIQAIADRVIELQNKNFDLK